MLFSSSPWQHKQDLLAGRDHLSNHKLQQIPEMLRTHVTYWLSKVKKCKSPLLHQENCNIKHSRNHLLFLDICKYYFLNLHIHSRGDTAEIKTTEM